MNRSRRANWKDEAPGLPPAEKLSALLNSYGLPGISSHLVVVEGRTDRELLGCAARLYLQRTGENLLQVPPQFGDERGVSVIAPAASAGIERGGASAVASFGEEIEPFYRVLERPTALSFVLDNDPAGRVAAEQLEARGYRRGSEVVLLDRAASGFVLMEGRAGAEIEDLVDISLHHRFFAEGGKSARLDFKRGEVVRYEWIGVDMKAAFREFVLKHATLEEMLELCRILVRCRAAWGLPESECATTLLLAGPLTTVGMPSA